MQAQDYGAAKWAVGQRVANATDAEMDRLYSDGLILRTHVMRPTWHWVLPEDIRWMLELTSSRVNAVSAYYHRQSGLDDSTFGAAEAAIAGALEGGYDRKRTDIASLLQAAGIPAAGIRLGYILMHAELTGLICSGPLRGKQHTYALLEERAPKTRIWSREEALAELTRRYFTGHGPALVRDFSWWSGLTAADAQAGIAMLGSELVRETVDDRTYWSLAASLSAKERWPVVHMLPNYDEYVIGYKDHAPSFDPSLFDIAPSPLEFDRHLLALNGYVIGGWRRELRRDAVSVSARSLRALTQSERRSLDATVEAYGRFLGVPATLSLDTPDISAKR